VPHFDVQTAASTTAWWLGEQIFSLAVLEALGISAMLTLMMRRFTSKLSRKHDTLAFGGLLFLTFLIAINSFGARDLKPNLAVTVNQAADAPLGEHDTAVYIVAQMTNRGNVQTAAVSYSLTADINGNTIAGTQEVVNTPGLLKFGDKTVPVYPNNQLNSGRAIMLPVGVPIAGFLLFKIPQIPEPLAKFIERGEFPCVRGAERPALRPARA
jgi:hypothetical protein